MPVILPNQISYSSFQHPSNDKVSLQFVHVLAYIPLTDKQTARNTKPPPSFASPLSGAGSVTRRFPQRELLLRLLHRLHVHHVAEPTASEQ